MDKTKRKVLALTVVSMLLLSTTAQQVIAWPCPPCPDCETCTETGCECQADCGCGGKTCSGCCDCSGCSCVDDDGKCDPDECCVDCECKQRCIPEGGSMCSYELPGPGIHDCEVVDPYHDPTCYELFADCGYLVTEGPYKNDICQPGCSCELDTAYCVKYRVASCQNDWAWWHPFNLVCMCKPTPGQPDVPSGSRTVCAE